jgi:hypothetical protein
VTVLKVFNGSSRHVFTADRNRWRVLASWTVSALSRNILGIAQWKLAGTIGAMICHLAMA